MNFDFDLSNIDVSGVSGQSLNFVGNGALQLLSGTTAQRPTPVAGKIRWNSDLILLDVAVSGSVWKNLQWQSAELDAVAALSSTGILVRTGSGAYSLRSITAPAAGFTITNSDGVSGNPTFALTNDLGAIESLNTNGMLTRTGTDTWVSRTISTASSSRITVTNGDGIAGNPTLDLATVSPSSSGTFQKFTADSYGRIGASTAVLAADITTALAYTPLNAAGDTMSAGFLTLFQDPTNPLHAATKQYVDQRAAGLDPKGSVRVASAGNFTVSNPGTAVIGGATLTSGDRVLLKAQTSGAENGIYVFNGSGVAMTRATDANSSALVTSGMFCFVTEGTYAATGWLLSTPDPITLGITSLTFTQFNGSTTYTGGTGITVSGGAISVDATTVLSGIVGLASNGLIAKTGSNTSAARTITAPAAGITVSNGDGVSGNPTLALANDLGAIEALNTNGILVRTTTDTWVSRAISGTTSQISVTNGDGIAGTPTLALTSDVVFPGTIGLTLVTGTNAQETGSTNGMLRYNSDIVSGGRLRQRFNAAWSNVGTGDGSVTSVGLSTSTDGLVIGATPVTTSGTITITLNAELQGLKTALVADTLGIPVQTASNTFAMRQVAAGTGISVTNPKGTAGDITITNTGVTSVGLSAPSFLTVGSSPVTSTGTLALTLTSTSQNFVLVGPTSGAGAPTQRLLVYGDLPIKLFVENPSSPTAPVATGNNSIAIGSGSNARILGAFANASGLFATAGDAQTGEYILRNITTTATVTELFLDGVTASQRLTLPNNSAYYVMIMVVGRRTDAAGGAAAHKHEFLITRDASAATTAIIGNVSKTVIAETNAGWDSAVTADTTNGSIKISVTGEAAKTIRWVASVFTTEVTN